MKHTKQILILLFSLALPAPYSAPNYAYYFDHAVDNAGRKNKVASESPCVSPTEQAASVEQVRGEDQVVCMGADRHHIDRDG